MAHHRAGRLDEAEKLYKSILTLQPSQPDALHYLGVLAQQRGDPAKAVELIGRAVRAWPDSAPMLANYAEVQRLAGQVEAAEVSCRRALELQPDHPGAQLTLALALAGQGRFEESEAAARTAHARWPDDSRIALALGDALRRQHRTSEAAEVYRGILATSPDDAAALTNLGLMLTETGEMEEGFALCRRAAELEADVATLTNLAKAQLEYGLIDEAMQTLEQALERSPNIPELSLLIGVAWAQLGDRLEAQQWLGRALELDPALDEAKIQLAELEADSDNHQGALEILDLVLREAPGQVQALAARAKVHLVLGDVDGAVADHREALRLRPDASALHATLGDTLSTAGDIDGALSSLRRAMELNPRNASAHASLLTTLRHKATDHERDTALALLQAPWMTNRRRAALNFGLAAYFDGAGQWATAEARMIAANAYRKTADEARHQHYDPAAYEGFVDRIIETFTPELFERLKGMGSDSARPVFIVGMPRSGTTLTEQIVATHPQAFGAGERPFATRSLLMLPHLLGEPETNPLDSLAKAGRAEFSAAAAWHLGQLAALDGGAALRIADKMPDNYHLLGWLAVLFPRARFISCRRDLRDVALSCWITNFAKIRWASDLDHLAHRIGQYLRLMAHWDKVLPVPVLEVQYETMVANQEAESRRLIDWIGLDWDDQCLSFHKTERLVRTASVTQVRQPIYQRSVERWRNYQEMLTPVIGQLS